MESTLISTPRGGGNTTVKKFYSVKTSQNSSNSGVNDDWILQEPNINKLDTLLQDLKSEREITRDKDLFENSLNNYKTVEEYDTIVRDTKQSYPSGVKSGSKSYYTKQEEVFVEPQYKSVDDIYHTTPTASSKSYYTSKHENVIREREREPQYKTITRRDETIERTLGSSGGNLSPVSGTSTMRSTRSINEQVPLKSAHSTQILESNELESLKLSDDILPIPGTKVTTTVRTYTYEVPSDGTIKRDVVIKDVHTTNSTSENNLSYIDSTTLPHRPNYTDSATLPARPPYDIDNNINYNYEEHVTKNSTTTSPRQTLPVPTSQKSVKYTSKTERYVDENEPLIPNDHTTTHHYVTKNNVVNVVPSPHPPQQHYPRSPPSTDNVDSSRSYYYSSSNQHTTNNYPNNQYPNQYPPNNYPPGNYPPNNYPPQHTPRNDRPPRSIEYRVESTTNVEHPHQQPPPPTNSVVTYKYSTTNTTTNSNRRDPPMPIDQPFPVYQDNGPMPNGKSPRHLNELLTNLDNGNEDGQTVIDGFHPKTEVETAVAKDGKVIVPSKNVAGPPVYYPPNHEMTLRRDQSAAYRARGGAWARGRGEYEYASESKSKTKTKSGGAVVPVCLPLCCAMPCSIM